MSIGRSAGVRDSRLKTSVQVIDTVEDRPSHLVGQSLTMPKNRGWTWAPLLSNAVALLPASIWQASTHTRSPAVGVPIAPTRTRWEVDVAVQDTVSRWNWSNRVFCEPVVTSATVSRTGASPVGTHRSEEHTSELQSRLHLVFR